MCARAGGEHFHARFGCEPDLLVRAPGRANLIGEHTDYNDGWVLPFAIDREIRFWVAPDDAGYLDCYSVAYEARARIDLRAPTTAPATPWAAYLAGVAALWPREHRPLPGARVLIESDLPAGCGLSSSAALEMAAVALFEWQTGAHLSDADAARLGQRVENEWLGLSSGVMDQYAIRAARAGHACRLDCRTLTVEHRPLALNGAALVLVDTGVRHSLADSAYNTRVEECRRAVAALHAEAGFGSHLRDYTLADLVAAQDALDETALRRARHVISENARVHAACDALEAGALGVLGRLLNDSHASLRDDYAVSCGELDRVAAAAQAHPASFGARMMGGGFGGAVLALIAADGERDFHAAMAHLSGLPPARLSPLTVRPSRGVSVRPL